MSTIGVISSLVLVFLGALFIFEWLKQRKADRLENERYAKELEASLQEEVKQQYDENILNDALQRLNALEGLSMLKAEWL
jgi:hypothetical protein